MQNRCFQVCVKDSSGILCCCNLSFDRLRMTNRNSKDIADGLTSGACGRRARPKFKNCYLFTQVRTQVHILILNINFQILNIVLIISVLQNIILLAS